MPLLKHYSALRGKSGRRSVKSYPMAWRIRPGQMQTETPSPMPLDYFTLDRIRRQHPAWRLLMAAHAPLIVSFLQRAFIEPNARVLSQSELASRLEDMLYQLRESLGDDAFPKTAGQYLDDWAQDDKGWLRKFYPADSDEPHFDLTPATEKAIAWLESLGGRAFVGTESRLLTVFELLRQMAEGAETDPRARIAELEKRKAEIDAEIARIEAGDMDILDDTALKDRFQQLGATARELLTDFREVEQNFRQLDQSVRERIALWDGAKGALLEQIFGERDAIADSDQGRSFRAFWDFLMSPSRQEELTALLERVLALPPIEQMRPDRRLKRIHYDWLEAGEQTQRTVARLSQQLRRYLDDQAWLENRRIMEVLHQIETRALALREQPPKGDFMTIDSPAPDIRLPMERPLYSPPFKPRLDDHIELGKDDVTPEILFEQEWVDKARLSGHLRRSLQLREQISLPELLAEHPLEQGLAELLAWFAIASESDHAVFDETRHDLIQWRDPDGRERQARLPRILFSR